MGKIYCKKGILAVLGLCGILAITLCAFTKADAQPNASVTYDAATHTLHIPAGVVDANDIYTTGAGAHANEMTSVVFEGNTQVQNTAQFEEVAKTGLFAGCSALANVTIEGTVSFPGENATLYKLFYECASLQSLDLSGFDVGNVVDLSYMFFGCEKLTSVNISSFSTAHVRSFGSMFEVCEKLSKISFPETFTTEAGQSFDSMFAGCSSLTSLDLSTFSSAGVEPSEEPFYLMFSDCINLETINLGKLQLPLFYNPETGDCCDMAAFAMLSEDSEGHNIFLPLPLLSKVTMMAGCLPSPLMYDKDTGILLGSFFDYNHPGGWNAYQNDVYQAHLGSYDDFATYQKTHPGFTTYTWGEEPEPSPEPTPGTEDGWVESDAGWQYVLNGEYLNDGWHYIIDQYGEHWYYFDADTYMATSRWIWDDSWEGWYWVCSTGPMIENLWQWIDNAWYGFWWGGKMCQGWVWDTYYNAWYFCNEYNGRVACNEWAYDGAWYYFDQNCQMVTNAWVGPYWLNEHGMWV